MNDYQILENKIDILTKEVKELKLMLISLNEKSGKINYDNMAEMAVTNFVIFKVLDTYMIERGNFNILNNLFGG